MTQRYAFAVRNSEATQGDLAFNESLGMLENGEYSDWVKAIFGSVKTITIIRAVKIIHWLVNTLADEFLVKSPKVQKQGAVHWNYHISPEVEIVGRDLHHSHAKGTFLGRDVHLGLASGKLRSVPCARV